MTKVKTKSLFLAALILLASAAPAFAGYKEGVAALRKADYPLALAEFLPTARQGVVAAQYNVGLLYHRGRGIKRDLTKARKWYRAAANQGHADAQNNLGSLYRRGQGVERNYETAVYWYKRAIEDSPLARNNLAFLHRYGLGVEKNNAEAARLLRWAVESGHTKSIFDLGKLYEKK